MPRLLHLLLLVGLLQACASRHTPPPLHEAASTGNIADLSSLLEQGEDPGRLDEQGRSPLHHAARSTQPNRAAIIRNLLAAGLDPDIHGEDGYTPLHEAKTPEAVNALLAAGADPTRASKQGVTPLHLATTATAVNTLIAAGADVNATDMWDYTPLHRAESAEVVQALLDNGANPEARNRLGDRPVDVSRQFGREEAVAVLDGITRPPGIGSIGAVLIRVGPGYLVDGLVPGAPAAQSGELRLGDAIVNVASGPGDDFFVLAGKDPERVAALIRGDVGTTLRLQVLGRDDVQTREVVLKRAKVTEAQKQAYHEQRKALVIVGTSGVYMSPYTTDGVVAEWVNQSVNHQMGSAVGSAVGATAGAMATRKALENVPGAGILGGFLGSKAGKAAGSTVADYASGGEAYRRETSDLSFRSLDDMATWLVREHGSKANFNDVINAVNRVYPGLGNAVRRAH